jgi:hypothetical protein
MMMNLYFALGVFLLIAVRIHLRTGALLRLQPGRVLLTPR